MSRKFEITDEQAEKVRRFHPRCKRKDFGAIGGGESYTFEPTGLGDIVTFRCKCGKELSLTDSEKW